MKTVFFASILCLAITGCMDGATADSTSQNPAFKPGENIFTEKIDSANFTSIKWLDGEQDLGKITEGEQVPVTFHFINAGEKPLIIYAVQPACGCTAAEPPKEPILPGKEGKIQAFFNSNGRVGTNNKSITVRANTNNGMDHILNFKTEVIKKSTP